MDSLTLLSINWNGLTAARLENLTSLLSEVRPDIPFLQETHASAKHKSSINGYCLYSEYSRAGPQGVLGGGVKIYVKSKNFRTKKFKD